MRIDFKFRHCSPSDELTDYVVTRLEKLEKYEQKPVRAEFTFSLEKEQKRVDLHVRGQDIEMHAHWSAEDFFTATDVALEKMARQLARKKAKIKAHKGYKNKAPKVS